MNSRRARALGIGATAALAAALVAPIAQAAERPSRPAGDTDRSPAAVAAAASPRPAPGDGLGDLAVPVLRRPVPLAPVRLDPNALATPAPATAADPAGTKGRTRAKVLYLTIDDGPDPVFTPEILRVLAANDAKATFFLLGRNAVDNRDLVADIRAQGHAIGNHTWNHPYLPNRSDAAIRSEFTRTRAVIGPTSCMRTPYGATSTRVVRVAKKLGMAEVDWGVDTNDWKRPGSKVIAQRIGRSKPGAIVLVHDGGGDRAQTVAALKRELPILREKGYTFATYPACR